MVSKFLLLIFFLVLPASQAGAQNRVLLFKKDRIIASFEEGEYIRFTKKQEEGYRRGLITGIYPNYFLMDTDTTFVYDIAKIDLRGKTITGFKTSSLGRGLLIAGVSLFLIDIFNKTVVMGKTYEPDSGVTNTSIILASSGLLMQLVNNDRFKVGRKRKVITLRAEL
ncbi:MAG: hypothetical protein RIB47_03795 [Cyclobacteriaceae bacterium]